MKIRSGSHANQNEWRTITGDISNSTARLDSVNIDSNSSSDRFTTVRTEATGNRAGRINIRRDGDDSVRGTHHDSGSKERRMEEICEHLTRSWGRLNRSERRRVNRGLMSGSFEPFKVVNKKLLAFTPLLLAGCSAADNVKEQGADVLRAAGEATKGVIDSSMTAWYGFIGQLYGTLIDVILYTPEALITNPEVHRLWFIFVGVSFAFLSSLVLIESFRVMFGKSRTNLLSLVSRTGVSFLALGFVLPAMTAGLWFINELVDYFVKVAHHNMEPGQYFGDTLAQSFANGGINFLASLVFIVLFLLYIFKILLYYGRRWFDIMVAAVISPLAFAANIFDFTNGYFQRWWNNVLQLYLVQVIHAVYVMVLGLIVLTPGEIKNAGDALFRILILIGALWRMSDPPSFVQPISGRETFNMTKAIGKKLPYVGRFVK